MKRIFGYDDTKDSLICLSSLMCHSTSSIFIKRNINSNPIVKNVTLLNTETLKEDPDNKANRLEIVVPW